MTAVPMAIYRTAGPGSRDDYVATVEAATPVEALELYAERAGIADYSLDQTALAYWLCPAHSRFHFYAYRGEA